MLPLHCTLFLQVKADDTVLQFYRKQRSSSLDARSDTGEIELVRTESVDEKLEREAEEAKQDGRFLDICDSDDDEDAVSAPAETPAGAATPKSSSTVVAVKVESASGKQCVKRKSTDDEDDEDTAAAHTAKSIRTSPSTAQVSVYAHLLNACEWLLS